MLDINLLITDKGGNPEIVRESQRRRGAKVETVDEVIELYKDWTKTRFELDAENKKINAVQRAIGQKFKAKEDASELLKEKEEITARKANLADIEKEKEAAWKDKLKMIGNIVHASVPTSMDEANNEVIRTYNHNDYKPVKRTDILSHHEVLTRIDGYDQERGAAVAGHRGYFLTNAGVDLYLALINYGLAFLGARGYKKLMTPFFMKQDMMAQTAQLSQFDEELYKVTGEGEDKYLIATSEQPISAYHAGTLFDKPSEQLPIRYAGFSTCFRKEAGSHGKETWGLFRVHQFEKVEQFCITEPEQSWDMFNEMIGNSEDFMKSLGISYRIVAIVSGALNDAAAKKYDLEAWFPFQGEYKELVSCSNCTDYQSRNLDIRCGSKNPQAREKKYAHCLNSTLCAAGRTMCAIMEQYQTPEGVVVPEPLRPFMGGVDFLPFVKEVPKRKD